MTPCISFRYHHVSHVSSPCSPPPPPRPFSSSRARRPLCHPLRRGTSLPIVFPRRFSPFCYDGFVNNGGSSRSEIFTRPRARARAISTCTDLTLRINRIANNVVRHIVTAVECESQLLDLIKGAHSCFIKKRAST